MCFNIIIDEDWKAIFKSNIFKVNLKFTYNSFTSAQSDILSLSLAWRQHDCHTIKVHEAQNELFQFSSDLTLTIPFYKKYHFRVFLLST